jgi:ubiquinol-cytochrome c reductase iron-sulfur subunit
MTTTTGGGHADETTRRDFLYIAAGAAGAVGTALAIWPFVDQMNPSADVLALSSTEVDLSGVAVGSSITVVWRGKPVFIRHRTAEEIAEAEADDSADMKDPEPDAERAEKPEWLVMIGICTHLGCIPLGEQGDYGGWFCPCHGSHYDTSGRIRKGPAPLNLEIPPYEYLDDTTIKIG